MRAAFHIYRQWLRDRRLSTISWSIGTVVVMVATAAFYPPLADLGDSFSQGGAAMDALLGLSSGIDATTPLGYLWISLYANVYPWMLMALGVSLGSSAIAADEGTGALEYLLSKAVTRSTVAFARFAAAITILVIVSVVSALSLVASMPFFELTDATTTTAADGSTSSVAGATVGDIANGTFASFAIALGLTGIAFLLGAATGRKGLAMGISAAVGIGGYVLYTLSSMSSSLDALTWLSPWRWYVNDAMLINGLTAEVFLPFITASVALILGWQLFLHRDLRGD